MKKKLKAVKEIKTVKIIDSFKSIDDLEGLSEKEALAKIEKDGFPAKIIMRDGKYYPGELKLEGKTVHLHIENEVVVLAYWDE
jgi:hypothetical protein